MPAGRWVQQTSWPSGSTSAAPPSRRPTSAPTRPLPADVQLIRSVGAGELLARSAVGSATASGLLEVPIAVAPEQVPASVQDGAVVDVYVVAPPASDAGARPAATSGPAIAQATVVDAPAVADSFGTSGKRQLVLAVKESEVKAFFALLSQYDDPVLTVVRHG